MPRIVVVGGTGHIGARVVQLLRARGVDVGIASRSHGVDLVSGEGLEEALHGAEVVIDVSKSGSNDPAELRAFFTRAAEHLTAAERVAGVQHHVMLSIAGLDRAADVPFYAAKAELESAIRASDTPFSILRATQFFEFAGAMAAASTDARSGEVRLPPILVQPVAGADVAAAVARLVDAEPTLGHSELAGPETFELDDFIRTVLGEHGTGGPILRDPDGRYFGGAIARDALLPGPDAQIAPTRLKDWLARTARDVGAEGD